MTPGTVNGVTDDELRTFLAVHDDPGAPDFIDVHYGDMFELYAIVIEAAISQRSPVWAMARDIAARTIERDSGPVRSAARQVLRDWSDIADSADGSDGPSGAVILGAVAEAKSWLTTANLDLLIDLVQISAMEQNARESAVLWSNACDGGYEAKWLENNRAQVTNCFYGLRGYRQDLIERGELDIAGRLDPAD